MQSQRKAMLDVFREKEEKVNKEKINFTKKKELHGAGVNSNIGGKA